MITNLEIKNFKSIKDVNINCKRINVFIGEPNVGKTNILEALSMFVAQTCSLQVPILKDYIRYEKINNLFYDNDRNNIIKIKTNLGVAYLRFHLNPINSYDILIDPYDKLFESPNFKIGHSLSEIYHTFDDYREKLRTLPDADAPSIAPFYYHFKDNDVFNPHSQGHVDLAYSTIIKRYIFKSLSKHESNYTLFLRPPYGDNLYSILEGNTMLYEEVVHFFTKFGLDLLIDTEANKLDIQKRVKNRVYKIPYSLTADTLQRIIFHLAAIETNNKSVLILEEPEAHSFPPYISLLADKIIGSKSNQFFVATHSPYLLTPFIEQCSYDEVAIFVCKYENYETKIKALSKKEIANIMETGIDLFYNIPAFKN